MGQELRFRAASEQVMRSISAPRERSGYRLVRSFDLQAVRTRQLEACACSHHGTDECTCQYVVALACPPLRAGTSTAPQGFPPYTSNGITLVTLQSVSGTGSKDRLHLTAVVGEAASEVADPGVDRPEGDEVRERGDDAANPHLEPGRKPGAGQGVV